jgi:hypothetical protein
MFRPEESKTANFRADYAKHADFCEVFQRDRGEAQRANAVAREHKSPVAYQMRN